MATKTPRISDLPQEMLDKIAMYLSQTEIHNLRSTSKNMYEWCEPAYFRNIVIASATKLRTFVDLISGSVQPKATRPERASSSGWSSKAMPAILCASTRSASAGIQFQLLRMRENIRVIDLQYRLDGSEHGSNAEKLLKKRSASDPALCLSIQLIAYHIPRASIKLSFYEPRPQGSVRGKKQAKMMEVEHMLSHALPNVIELHLSCTDFANRIKDDLMSEIDSTICRGSRSCIPAGDDFSSAFDDPKTFEAYLDLQRYPHLKRLTIHSPCKISSDETEDDLDFWDSSSGFAEEMSYPASEGIAQITFAKCLDSPIATRTIESMTLTDFSSIRFGNPLLPTFWQSATSRTTQMLKLLYCKFDRHTIIDTLKALQSKNHTNISHFTLVKPEYTEILDVDSLHDFADSDGIGFLKYTSGINCLCDFYGKTCARFTTFDLVLPRICHRLIKSLLRGAVAGPTVHRIIGKESFCGIIADGDGESIWDDAAWEYVQKCVSNAAKADEGHKMVWYLGFDKTGECYRFCGDEKETVDLRMVMEDMTHSTYPQMRL